MHVHSRTHNKKMGWGMMELKCKTCGDIVEEACPRFVCMTQDFIDKFGRGGV